MQTITVEIPDRLALMLDQVCMENALIKQQVVSELVQRYLEDIEDAAAAMNALAECGESIGIEQMRKKLGLDN